MSQYNELVSSKDMYAFIICDFSPKFTPVYEEVIAPAVKAAGLRPVRCDNVHSISAEVHSQIAQLIENAAICIADLTLCRLFSYANVFLELGIALAHHRPIIMMTQDNDIPFDVQSYRMLPYHVSEKGKREAKRILTETLKAQLFPDSDCLRQMLSPLKLPHNIISGKVTDAYMQNLEPPVDEKYRQRLDTISYERNALLSLAECFQKIPEEHGALNCDYANNEVNQAPFSRGNVYIFGGPGPNNMFWPATALAHAAYENALDIRFENLPNGKKRYYIARNGVKYPEDQYELFEQSRDIGFVMRFPNPMYPGAMITLAAGLRSYGTEGAIRLLTEPKYIRDLAAFGQMNAPNGFWGLVEVRYTNGNKRIDSAHMIGSEALRVRPERQGTSDQSNHQM